MGIEFVNMAAERVITGHQQFQAPLEGESFIQTERELWTKDPVGAIKLHLGLAEAIAAGIISIVVENEDSKPIKPKDLGV